MHPNDSSLCVKVNFQYGKVHLLQRELDIYLAVKDKLGDYIVSYQPELEPTQLGKGLVCELLRNDDGAYASNLNKYLREKGLSEDLRNQMNGFYNILVENNIFFYDFNLGNFLIHVVDGHEKLIYSDLKSYNRYKPWVFLRAERICPFIARNRMAGRWESFQENVERVLKTRTQ